MKNKETLEEAAEDTTNKYINEREKHTAYLEFIEGAKWQSETIGLMEIELRHTKTLLASCEKALENRDNQAERMYSEEDLKEAYFSAISSTGEGWNAEYANGNNPNIEEEFSKGFAQWLKQFKKK
jgi:hypothetical protein